MFSVTTYKLATTVFAILSVLSANVFLLAQDKQPDFPYQAMVIADNAKLHSGPDAVHYTTDELERDSTVQVHRHDPGGWCAIRPPSGSFSLVPESAVTRIADNIGRIKEDGVQAWVGTRLGTVEVPLWQVKLRRDEDVGILGEVSWPNPEGYSTIWYQIAPPAGEFRWIRISDLRLPKNLNDLPEIALSDTKAPDAKAPESKTLDSPAVNRIRASEPLQSQAEARSAIRQSSYQEADSEPVLADPQFDDFQQQELNLNPPSENADTVNRGWRQASRPIRVADNKSEFGSIKPFKTPALDAPVIGAGQIPRNNSQSNIDQSASASSSDSNSNATSNDIAGMIVPITPISGPVSERIRKLESQLTAEMQKPPAQWELESVLRQSTSIASSTNDVREREHAQRLQQKIRNCVNIQSRYSDAFSNKASATPVSTPVPTATDVQLGTTYDANGWLNQLVRDNGRMTPTYVLEDDNGKITHHIAPSPGLNLQRYVKQKVGIIGRRGFHRNLGLNHVTAERIVVLNKRR